MSEQATAEQKKSQKTIQGIVVSDKMAKTIVIEVRQRVTLPGIKKIVRRTKRIKIHDENSEAGVGDLVSAVETRPLSKHKRHKLLQVIEKAK